MSTTYRVLFVDDDKQQFTMIQDLLSLSKISHFDLEWASTFEAAMEAIRRKNHDAYLLDQRLGDRTGLELLRLVAHEGCQGPFIMLTAYGNKDLDLESMKAGAADYLLKGQITGDILERSIRYAVERKRAMHALKGSQEYAHNIINSSLDMIIAVDRFRRIIEFNRAAEQGFGYRAAEMLGKHVELLYANPEESLEVNATLLKEGKCVREILNLRKNGQTFPSFLSASLMRDASGQIVGAMGISRDISEQKRAQDEIQRLNSELEKRVRERTHDLEATTKALQAEIAQRQRAEEQKEAVIHQLKEALSQVKTLRGLLPICSHCHKIRDENGDWTPLEDFIAMKSEAAFTHTICPGCSVKFFPPATKP